MRYEDRGASADKKEVHAAIRGEDPGLFPGAFCKILPDSLTQSEDHCVLIHADGAGTKSVVAYLWWKETGDASAFRGLAQDSLVMNLDDLLCVGAQGPFLLSNTIGRNAKLISGEVIAQIIAGYRDCIEMLGTYGIEIQSGGGETADLGDAVRTWIQRWSREWSGAKLFPAKSFGRALFWWAFLPRAKLFMNPRKTPASGVTA